MSHRYAPLPNPRSENPTQREQEDEMAAAFDYSEDDEDEHDTSETQPLNAMASSNNRDTPLTSAQASTTSHEPRTYDFENVDYDYPPPGSPPLPSSRALPNDIGNTNGLVPSFDSVRPPRQNWLQRTAAAVIPYTVAERLGVAPHRPTGPVGGGESNDGVFANVTAKPSAPIRVQDGDNTYLVPEESGNEPPPSYAIAQADAVPPYWETTIHAPFSPDSAGEMIVDSLPTGSVFSFLWNMLVSVSFQFVGFLLTYLLHTTHAARLGSRAGLGITLIQYGFALRGKIDAINGDGDGWGGWQDPAPTFATGAEADAWFKEHGMMRNGTDSMPIGPMPDDQTGSMVADATTEWLSFFLMTVGWFILLTSLLGFWRVKRWERGILASQRESSAAAQSTTGNTPLVSRIEQVFGLRGGAPGDLFRQGFGFGSRRNQEEEDNTRAILRAEEGEATVVQASERVPILDPNDPEGSRRMLHAIALESHLQTQLRRAGFI